MQRSSCRRPGRGWRQRSTPSGRRWRRRRGEAEKWLRQAIALQPKHGRAWGNLALALGQQGRYKESFEAFTRVVSPAQAHSNLGMLLAQQGQSALAQAAFRQALTLEPDLKPARFALTQLEQTWTAPQPRP